MKKIIAVIAFLVSLNSFGQVTEAVDSRIDTKVPALVKVEVENKLGMIEFDTLYIRYVSKTGNIDTLTTPGIYQLSVTGSASAVRFVVVSRNSNGVYSIRTSNPLAWSGAGTWATSVVNNRVIVSTTNNNIIYQREKIQ